MKRHNATGITTFKRGSAVGGTCQKLWKIEKRS